MQSERVADDPRAGKDSGNPDPARPRWNLVYAAVLVHLALWIAILAVFSRFFGSH